MSNTKRLRRRRHKLFKENPYCFYCGEEMVLRESRGGGIWPPNAATIEHLISRNNPLRGVIEGKTVLACKQCNEQAGAEEERALPIEELWRRAGHLKRMINVS